MRYVDGTKVKELFSCTRQPFLAFHLAKDSAQPPTPRFLVYARTGQRVEREILDRIAPEAAAFPGGDLEAGFRATLELMASRAPSISNGVLKLGEFVGRPDLLCFDEEEGRYEVADVKSTMKVKTSARMQVAFYSRLLSQVADPPRRGHVILRDGSRHSFALADLEASLARVLEVLQSMRQSRAADPGPIWRDICIDCRWREHCAADLAGRDGLETIPGITRAQVAALRAAGASRPSGFAGLATLADASQLDELATRSELPRELLRGLSARALAVSEGRAIRLRPARDELRSAGFALAAAFSERLVEPHVAIGGMVFGDVPKFRIRFLGTRRPSGSEHGHDPRAELRDLLKNLANSRGPIVTFGGDVFRALDSALAAHELSADLALLRSRSIDLRAELRKTFALPSSDQTPRLAAIALGIPASHADAGADDGVEVAALSWLEGEPEPSGESHASDAPDAPGDVLERWLRRDLESMSRIRSRMLEPEAA